MLIQKSAQYYSVDETKAGQRIDNFLISLLKTVPKTRIYKMIRKGEVRANGKRISADYRLEKDDKIRIPPLYLWQNEEQISKPSSKLQQRLKQAVLYEDDRLVVLNKPSGMAVHGGSGLDFGVIELWRLIHPELRFIELVHRLDRETSGCLILAKKPSMLKELHALLRNKQVEKVYWALVKGRWPESLTKIELPLRKYQLRSGERMVCVDKHEGKEAITLFRPLTYFEQSTLVEAKPITGRTHQIRVHAAEAGYDIICDEKYGDKEVNKKMRAYGCHRLFLHAAKLSFLLNEQLFSVQADLEPALAECLRRLPRQEPLKTALTEV